MDKMMNLEVLSSIKGAQESDVVNSLLDIIKNAPSPDGQATGLDKGNCVSIDDLREDVVCKSSENQRNLIVENFPNQENDYLVVLKVVEE